MTPAQEFYTYAVALMAALVLVMVAIVAFTRAALWVIDRMNTPAADKPYDWATDAPEYRDIAAWERELEETL